MAKEPYVTVNIIDDTLGLGTDPVDTGTSILLPVISPSGRSSCYYVSGPSAFKMEYNDSKKITPSDHKTMIYARALSAHTPIYVKRVCRDNILGGIDSLNNSLVYVDKDTLEPLVGAGEVQLYIKDKKTRAEMLSKFKDAMATVDNEIYVLAENTIITTKYDDSDDATTEIKESFFTRNPAYENIRELIKDYSTPSINQCVYLQSEITENQTVYVTINGTTRYTLTSDDNNLRDFYFKLVSDGICPDAIIGTGACYDFVSNPLQPTLNEVDATKTNIKGLLFFSNSVSVKVETSDEETTIAPIVNKLPADVASKIRILTLYTSDEWENEYKTSDFCIKFVFQGNDKYQFVSDAKQQDKGFGGEVVVINVTDEDGAKITNQYDVVRAIVNNLNSIHNVCTTGKDTVLVPDLLSVSCSEDSSIQVKQTTNVINSTVDYAKYAIVSLTPNSTNDIKISISTPKVSNPELQHLVIEFGNITEEYDFSMTEGAVDGYGTDISYTIINANSQYIRIVPLNGNQYTSNFTTNIGHAITNDYVDEDDIATALQGMVDDETNPILFDYVSDCGIVGNSSITSAIKSCMDAWNSFYVASCPTSGYTKTQLKSIATALGDTYNITFPVYTARCSDIDQGTVIMPGSYWYLVRRFDLASTQLEYTALFGDRGKISITPLKVFNKSDREWLLDYRIPTLFPKVSTSGSITYYQNLDCTLQSETSYMQDVNIVLMTKKICQVAQNYSKTIIGHANTRALRLQVEKDLLSNIQDRLRVGTEYGPISVSIKCDSVTTQNLIDRGYAKIEIYASFTRAIQNVLIYTHVVAVNQEANNG